MKYVIACDHDYYPSVQFCDTREEADTIAAQWCEEDKTHGMGDSYGDGDKPAKRFVVVAEIVSRAELTPRDKMGGQLKA